MNEQQLAEFKALAEGIIALETAGLLLKGKNPEGDEACIAASGDLQVELLKYLCAGLGVDSPY